VLASLRRFIVRSAIGKGVLGESRLWLVVAVAIGVRRVVRYLSGAEPKVLYSEELGPRDRLLISAVDDAT
jgi:hypothetical protein